MNRQHKQRELIHTLSHKKGKHCMIKEREEEEEEGIEEWKTNEEAEARKTGIKCPEEEKMTD